eukprot:TRINITY_DN33883_c0_g1_i1.p1 TRINITY_DN33883_c0_g1~~TRINITY_DN33883_c0_g1_i1.p1  ORF type:complete len:425 (-),score=140.81 TRINITY_DN33883_c0_g1_i1:132-1406(-)
MGKLPHSISSGSQYTHTEWTNSNLDHFHNADQSRHTAERIRAEANLLINERGAVTIQVQQDVNNRLGDRVRDIREWREELKTELDKNEEETEHLEEAMRHLDYAYSQSKRPLQVSIECMNQRENRVGIDQVKDMVDSNLKKENDNIRKYQQLMKVLIEKVEKQIESNKDAQNALSKDLEMKDEAFGIDQACFVTHNNSSELSLHSGIERVEQAASVPQSWQEYSQSNIRLSKAARETSEENRSSIDSLINDAARDMLNHWNITNREFQQRISETQETHGKLTTHLHLVDKEILEMDCLIDQISSAKRAKQGPLKVAQTRLKKRSHRPDVESCNDPPHNKLVDEVSTLNDSIVLLDQKLTESEAARLDLLSNRQRLENDARVKENSLTIDQSKCMTLRVNFPFNIRCSVSSKRVTRRKYRINADV